MQLLRDPPCEAHTVDVTSVEQCLPQSEHLLVLAPPFASTLWHSQSRHTPPPAQPLVPLK
jgi:hypothetical protein